MTARWIPVVLVWLTVATALLELFAQLQLILIDVQQYLTVLMVFFFMGALIFGWRQFNRDCNHILLLIQNWDEDMKQDIPTFLSARKFRLITAVSFLTLILLTRFLFSTFPNQQQTYEILLYVFLIGLFHVALVSSLILFKLSRTLRWIQRENELAISEKA